MADFADIATERQAEHLADCLAGIRRPSGVSATHCDECGDVIPEGRRRAWPGVRLCVSCQAEAEGR
jgi:phage/conjugal plasmid C-4 type zinc finger TraR family protein